MDGGRRLLRPVREAFEGFQPSAPVHAGVVHIAPALVFSADYGRRASSRRVSSSVNRVLALFIAPGVGTLVALLLLIGVGLVMVHGLAANIPPSLRPKAACRIMPPGSRASPSGPSRSPVHML